MRSSLGNGFGAAVLLSAGLLGAEPQARTARLVYTRGDGAWLCPDEKAVREAVSVRLGYDPFQSGASTTVTATVRMRGGALLGEVALRDAKGTVSGSRTLDAAEDDCVELISSMALSISIAIDPQSLFRPAPPSPLLRAPPPPRPTLSLPAKSKDAELPRLFPPPPLPVLLPEPLPQRRLLMHAGVGGVLSLGSAPGISGGLAVELGGRWDAFGIRLEGRVDPPISTSFSNSASVSVLLLALRLLPCYHYRIVHLCGLASIGVIRGSSSGVPAPRDGSALSAAAGLRAGVEIPLVGRFSADFHGDVAAIFPRTTLELYNRPVWTTPPAAAALGAGLLVHFP